MYSRTVFPWIATREEISRTQGFSRSISACCSRETVSQESWPGPMHHFWQKRRTAPGSISIGRVPNPSRKRKQRALSSASPPNRMRAPDGSPARRVAAVVAVKAPLKKDFRQAWLFHCRLPSLPPKKQKTGQALSPALFRFGFGEYYYYPLARAFSRSVSFTMKFHESRHMSSIVRVASQPSSFFAFDTSA